MDTYDDMRERVRRAGGGRTMMPGTPLAALCFALGVVGAKGCADLYRAHKPMSAACYGTAAVILFCAGIMALGAGNG